MQLPRMLFEIKIPAEPFSTNIASKRLSFVVGVHMESQIVDLVKRFIADAAFVCLFTTMSQSMVLVISFLVKSFAAELANKWFVTSVDSGVSI